MIEPTVEPPAEDRVTHTAGSGGRDYHGRGPRGPLLGAVPGRRSPAQQFDRIALDVTTTVAHRWLDHTGPVELTVEEVPTLPDHWSAPTIPLSTWIPGRGRSASKLVLFRRPIEHRAGNRSELQALLFTVVVEQLAEVLGRSAGEIHPDYED